MAEQKKEKPKQLPKAALPNIREKPKEDETRWQFALEGAGDGRLGCL